MRALITRPRIDAIETADHLLRRGIEPVIEPVLEIVALPGAKPDLAGVQAVLFTSANGVRAFAAADPARDFPVFAVGDATASEARRLGFARVASARGDVEDLARLVAKSLDPGAGAVLHAAGSVAAGDLAGILSQSGFSVRRAVLYESKPVENFSPGTLEQLHNNAIGMVLFFSPRTAAAFVTLAVAAGLEAALGGTAAFCLSEAVTRAARGIEWQETICASRPELAALMNEIDGWMRRT
jgi:uroporphyrinogen-III synthase